MRAARYEKQGPAREVLKIVEMADPTPEFWHRIRPTIVLSTRTDKHHGVRGEVPLKTV
jgi:hypothetical protein